MTDRVTPGSAAFAVAMWGALSACAAPPQQHTPASTPTVALEPAPSAQAPPPPAGPLAARDLCAAHIRDAEMRFAQLATCENEGGGFDAVEMMRTCVATSHGAWAVTLLDAHVAPDCGGGSGFTQAARATWAPAHADAADATGTWATGEGHAFTADTFHTTHVRLDATFDYDGDGEPEAVFAYSETGHSWTGASGGFVVTFRSGHVAPYAPAATLRPVRAEDVDGDGRPDLVVTEPYVGEVAADSSRAELSSVGPYFAAHSLPDGSFSLSDEVATRYAARDCAAAPARVVVAEGRKVDELKSLLNVRCARLRGASTADVTRAITSACKMPGNSDDLVAKGPGVCLMMKLMLAWAAAVPPLTLRP